MRRKTYLFAASLYRQRPFNVSLGFRIKEDRQKLKTDIFSDRSERRLLFCSFMDNQMNYAFDLDHHRIPWGIGRGNVADSRSLFLPLSLRALALLSGVCVSSSLGVWHRTIFCGEYLFPPPCNQSC